jgi:hypothetical protein
MLTPFPPPPDPRALAALAAMLERPLIPSMSQDGHARGGHDEAPRDASGPAAKGPVLVTLAGVQLKPVEYLWPQRVPRGKLIGLMGDPGLGKSLLALDIAARLSTGAPWPDGGVALQGDVIILSAEDDSADTILPRALVMGADLTKLHVLQAIRDTTGERCVDLSRDMARLEQIVIEKSARLVVIDPIDAYLGSQVDSHNNASVRSVLAPLAALGMRTGVTVLVVMHLNKAEDRRAIYRALGSIGYIAAARSTLAVGVDPDDRTRRLVVSLKPNLNAEASPLAYRVIGACPICCALDVGPKCQTCQLWSVGYLEWSGEPVKPITANELLGAAPAPEGGAGPRQEARDFLLRELAGGHEVESRVLIEMAADNGISRRTLFRAKSELGIHARLDGQPGTPGQRWHWSLGVTPEEAQRLAEGRRQEAT